MSVGSAWTKIRVEGEMLSMTRLAGKPNGIVPTQNPQQRYQRHEVLLGNADQGAIDQDQLDPRTRSHTPDGQLQEVS
jgi:hypothetical protein